MRDTTDERIEAGLDKSGECWSWKGAHWGTKRNRPVVHVTALQRSVSVYRYLYERDVAPIPDGFTIDHLCGNPWCCNPAHLDACENSENLRRSHAERRRRRDAELSGAVVIRP